MTAVAVTGHLSAPAYGLRMDLHEGMDDMADWAELHHFGKNNDGQLFAVDVPRYDYGLPGKIGQATLSHDAIPGRYEATYDFGDEALTRWGHRGIMTCAMRILLDRLVDSDANAHTVEFIIQPENYRSIGLAKKLGARCNVANRGKYELTLAEYTRAQQERRAQRV